ncbi:epoxide hydrolase family protein [Pseudonocardia sp. ICBG162]|uniref:epoxide hydrolase family protein n=1 Tax=Pseudonocardia sp. ICBG162 TaxID=2846761 RepID=UPI001CF6BF77|nr:epoxide hydrolase family protein [Pseudonocardia sp. ICBG162]
MTNNGIHPFRIDVAQTELDDMRARIANTRWARELPGLGWGRGVPTSYLRRIAEYWQHTFDWRAAETRLNALPQFVTEIDGQPIHFAHVRSPEPEARPMLMLHGWPSSFAEFLDVVGPLTDPVTHGGRAEDAVHLVLPSLPGFGFSAVTEAGWGDLFRVAGAFAELMTRLGYERFLAQGTDVGSGVVAMLPMAAAGRVIATHVNGPTPFPLGPEVSLDGLAGGDLDRAQRFNTFREDGTGYLHIQATRPQTIAYGLTDSPVAQLAWIVEKFAEWTDPSYELPEDAVDLDLLLTTVSLYWFNELGWSTAHTLYEGMQAYKAFARPAGDKEVGWGDSGGWSDAGGWTPPPAPPSAVSVFAADLSVRREVDPAGAHAAWTEHDRGGHFPAMEVPELLVTDIQEFFRGRD